MTLFVKIDQFFDEKRQNMLSLKVNVVEYIVCNGITFSAIELPSECIEIVDIVKKFKGQENRGLFDVAKSGELEVVKLFLKRGADLLDYGLFGAVSGNHIEIIDFLIDKGANNFNAALVHASAHGNLELTKYLLDKGADDLYSVLVNAVHNNRVELVEFFLNKATDRIDRLIAGALWKGHKHLVDYLMTRMSSVTENIKYFVQCAIEGGNPELLEYIIEHFAHLSTRAPANSVRSLKFSEGFVDFYSLLTKSLANSGSVEILKFLYGYIDFYEYIDWSEALFYAAQKNHKHFVDFFLSKQGDIKYGLYGAIRGSHIELVEFFMNKFDNTQLDVDECLWRAVLSCNIDVVKYFLIEGLRIEHYREAHRQGTDRMNRCLKIGLHEEYFKLKDVIDFLNSHALRH